MTKNREEKALPSPLYFFDVQWFFKTLVYQTPCPCRSLSFVLDLYNC